ncbi:uncharacterized protein [Euwallacea similis]|uniref:uncharacterized protein isoform X2 n=1 Tax=Euwallacea similis TaxID=1736056 RepID=UPI00344BA1A0
MDNLTETFPLDTERLRNLNRKDLEYSINLLNAKELQPIKAVCNISEELSEQQILKLRLEAKQNWQKHKIIEEREKMSEANIEEYKSQLCKLTDMLADTEKGYAEKKDQQKKLKKISRNFAKAIHQYSVNFNFKVSVKKHFNNKLFIASIKVKEASIDFIISHDEKSVVDFDASLVLSSDEVQELKEAASIGNNLLDIGVILKRLRPLIMTTSTN